MGLKSCEIYFDNQANTYYAGQTVNGRIDYIFDAPKKVRGIRIKIKGVANTRFKITKSVMGYDGKRHRKKVVYHGEEEYFNIKYYLIGGQSSDEIEIPAGKMSYPFTCNLPPTLPSSFEGEHGHVRYTVKVTLDRPWKFDQETKVAFTVISSLDLNMMPRLKDPYKTEREETFCCCCCRSGPLTLVVHLPCTGFVPGQKIPVTAEVDNASYVDVELLKYMLYKLVTFRSQIPKTVIKVSKILIASLSHGPINRGQSRTTNHDIEIPSLPASNLTNCGIIDVHYELNVEAKTSGCHMNFDVTIPVTIGTIPFVSFFPHPVLNIPTINTNQENVNQPLMSGNAINLGTGGWNAPGQAFGDPNYPLYPSHSQILPPTIDPPTYAESQFGTKSIRDPTDNQYMQFAYNAQGYAPRYPVYECSPTAPPCSP